MNIPMFQWHSVAPSGIFEHICRRKSLVCLETAVLRFAKISLSKSCSRKAAHLKNGHFSTSVSSLIFTFIEQRQKNFALLIAALFKQDVMFSVQKVLEWIKNRQVHQVHQFHNEWYLSIKLRND